MEEELEIKANRGRVGCCELGVLQAAQGIKPTRHEWAFYPILWVRFRVHSPIRANMENVQCRFPGSKHLR